MTLPGRITITRAELETIVEAVYFIADEARVDAERRQELDALAARLNQSELCTIEVTDAAKQSAEEVARLREERR